MSAGERGHRLRRWAGSARRGVFLKGRAARSADARVASLAPEEPKAPPRRALDTLIAPRRVGAARGAVRAGRRAADHVHVALGDVAQSLFGVGREVHYLLNWVSFPDWPRVSMEVWPAINLEKLFHGGAGRIGGGVVGGGDEAEGRRARPAQKVRSEPFVPWRSEPAAAARSAGGGWRACWPPRRRRAALRCCGRHYQGQQCRAVARSRRPQKIRRRPAPRREVVWHSWSGRWG